MSFNSCNSCNGCYILADGTKIKISKLGFDSVRYFNLQTAEEITNSTFITSINAEITGGLPLADCDELLASNGLSVEELYLTPGDDSTPVIGLEFKDPAGVVIASFTEEIYTLVADAVNNKFKLNSDKRGDVSQFRILSQPNTNPELQDYLFQVSLDGSTWTTIQTIPTLKKDFRLEVANFNPLTEVITLEVHDQDGVVKETFTLNLSVFLKADEIESADGSLFIIETLGTEGVDDKQLDFRVNVTTVTQDVCIKDASGKRALGVYSFNALYDDALLTPIVKSKRLIIKEIETGFAKPVGSYIEADLAGLTIKEISCSCECFDLLTDPFV